VHSGGSGGIDLVHVLVRVLSGGEVLGSRKQYLY